MSVSSVIYILLVTVAECSLDIVHHLSYICVYTYDVTESGFRVKGSLLASEAPYVGHKSVTKLVQYILYIMPRRKTFREAFCKDTRQ
jgi:hypothetical protein